MSMNLLIVESPAKCQKIQGFLGASWRVVATMGHIRALKEDITAIGFVKGARHHTWSPTYEALSTKKGAITALKSATKGARVYLGSDDDREGEAIAWHTCQVLGLDPATTPRVTFHEITETALKAAVANPGRIDLNKFYAQQARSMLDMLIGFTLSPALWRGVGYQPGLSAGRCQTPALRLIYDRDREIEAHQATASWRIQVMATLTWKAGGFTEETATEALRAAPKLLTVTDRRERVATSQPPKPFITSSLQQEASSRLNMNPKATMVAAQKLYEAGHITYMRTDSMAISEEATAEAVAVIKARWGDEFVGCAAAQEAKPVKAKKTKKAEASPDTVVAQAAHETSGKPDVTAHILTSQNAHEAIRPTHFDATPDVSPQEARLYTLIWNRTIQSLMAPEKRDVITLTGSIGVAVTTECERTAFAGWRALEPVKDDDYAAVAAIAVGATIPWTKITATEVLTTPPARYTEASLIRELESRGIGRPSTYATLVETVLDRKYVEKRTVTAAPVTVRGLERTSKGVTPTTRQEKSGGEKDKLITTALGRTVIEWLISKFTILEYDFTASMEARLDEVAKGQRTWATVLDEIWERYAEDYASIMDSAGGSAKNLGDGYKLVVSKKGPLFVYESEGGTKFATVPDTVSVQTATRADAEAAFAAIAVGDLEGEPVTIRKGPYGYYAAWRTFKVNCKADASLEELTPRLLDTGDHTVGPYKIKRGPYGLYMYKTGGTKKPTFDSLPDTTDWAHLTPEGAEQIYKTLSKRLKNKSP
jgi:DNA topoisomerase-1